MIDCKMCKGKAVKLYRHNNSKHLKQWTTVAYMCRDCGYIWKKEILNVPDLTIVGVKESD